MADKNFSTGALATAAKLAADLSSAELASAAKLAAALTSEDIASISELVDHIAEAPEGNILLAESIPLIREDGSDVGSIDLDGDEWVFVLAEGAVKAVEVEEKKAPTKPAAAKKAPAAKTAAKSEPVEDTKPDADEVDETAGADEDDTPMVLADEKPAAKSAPRRPAPADDDDF